MDAQLADFPGVRGWMQRVTSEPAPHCAHVNTMLHKAAAAAQWRRERQPQQQAKLCQPCMMAAEIHAVSALMPQIFSQWLKTDVIRLMRRLTLTMGI